MKKRDERGQKMSDAWIGVDFDGTLAEHKFPKLGLPIPYMFQRVQEWVAQGKNVKIMTAQAARGSEYGTVLERIKLIQDWCEQNGLPRLEVTASKDFNMIELWDDRAIQVERDTGILMTKLAYEQGYADGLTIRRK